MASTLTKRQQNLAIVISFIFITLACFILHEYDPTINNFLLIAGIFIAIGIALLCFLITGRFVGNGNVEGISFKEVSGGFLMFVLILSIWIKYYSVERPKLTLNNPQDSEIWSRANQKFQWFNALYVLANENHSTVQFNNIKNKKVMYELLLFDCSDSIQRVHDFLFKFNKMKKFLGNINKKAQAENIKLENFIRVAIKRTNNIPTISFFKTELNNERRTPYIIMYLNEVFKSSRPDKCFISEDLEISTHYNEIFSNNWDEAIELDVLAILNDTADYVTDWTPYIKK